MDEGCTFEFIPHRGITKDVLKFYGVLTKVDANGAPKEVAFPYGAGAIVRDFEGKNFHAVGDLKSSKLFGMDKFPPGCNDSITVTEGGYDALSVYQIIGRPAVSVKSATSARKECAIHREYLNSFQKIYLCLDSDNPGQDATKEIAMLFDANKVVVVNMGAFKDANEFLQKGQEQKFHTCWQNAKVFMPKDIIASYEDIDKILHKQGEQAVATYPFPHLNYMLYGIRLGECILVTAQEKVGKTEVMRTVEHHLLKTTDLNIGIIHLEEQEKRSIQGLAGIEMKLPAHLPDSGVSNEDVMATYRDLTKRDGRLHFYAHFGSDDPDLILDIIRYLATVRDCKFIFLDHITMLVTGFEDEGERKRLDYLSTRLAMMTRELGFTLFLVSHVNDDGKTRGSRNIAKVADTIIHMDRNIEADNVDTRNKTHLLVRGNRYAGITGPAGTLMFDPKTFTLKEMELVDVEASPGF